MKRFILIISFLLIPLALTAQQAKMLTRSANKQYNEGKYRDAEVAYLRALEHDKQFNAANYGLANSYYKQGKVNEAAKAYTALAENRKLKPEEMADVLRNLGNTLMKSKTYDKAIETYKQALLLNPSDNNTRYNYTLAKKLLQQQQQNQQQQNKEKNKDQEQQQQEQNREKPSDNRQMSQEDARQLLDAYKQDEEQTRRRLEQREKKPNQNSHQKKW